MSISNPEKREILILYVRMATFIIGVLILGFTHKASALCDFPLELQGTVISTGGRYHRMEQMNWTRSDGVLLTCEYTDGNLYVVRIEQEGIDIVECHQFIRASDVMYEVQLRTEKTPYYIRSGADISDTSYCVPKTDKPHEFVVFIKPEAITRDYPCPTNLQKMFSYAVKRGDEGDVQCYCDSSIDTCSNVNRMALNYSRCSIPVVPAGDGILKCVYSKQETSGQTYLLVRWHDNIIIPSNNDTLKFSTDAFACVVYKDYADGRLEATIIPLDQSQRTCGLKQTDVVIDNRLNGIQLTLQKALECTEAGNTGFFEYRKAHCSSTVNNVALMMIILPFISAAEILNKFNLVY